MKFSFSIFFLGVVLDSSTTGSGQLEIRLVNGTSHCNGLVEFLHNGQWGTVCDDDWGIEEATVVCQQLRCGPAISATLEAQFGGKTGPIWLDEVRCSGTESALSQCPASNWGEHDCTHEEDAVVCSGMMYSDTADSSQVEIRLVNGSDKCSGRVELLHNGTWGTVCGPFWGLEDARVVCRQLVCGAAESALHAAEFGRGTGPIWLDDVRCTGNESNLSQCPKMPWGKHDCKHEEDAGVVCSGVKEFTDIADLDPGKIRLVEGPRRCSGEIEIFVYGQWNGDCTTGLSMWEAKVICQQLDCGVGMFTPSKQSGNRMPLINLGGIRCTGKETAINQCRGQLEQSRDWCPKAVLECSGAASDFLQVKIRLVGGSSRCSGRVEVLFRGQWGTIYGDDWDIEDARVVCRQLGCGEASSALRYAAFGIGSVPISLEEVQGKGSESSLIQCPASPEISNCFPLNVAAVICSEIRLANGPSRCSGRIEVFHNQQWGTVCDAGWDLQDAHVACREADCGNASKAFGGAFFGQGSGPIWMEGVNCTGEEASLTKCPRKSLAEHSCDHSQDASVVCSGPVRLVNGSSHCSGRVELLHNQQWGSLCANSSDMRTAHILCRTLGCGSALSAIKDTRFGSGVGPIWQSHIICIGKQAALEDCFQVVWEEHDCSNGEYAGIVCSDSTVIRLVNGTSPCSGRVEVLHNRQWLTLCDEGWDLKSAKVVCRETGCGPPLSAPRGAHFGRGHGPTWLTGIHCQGTETSFKECTQNHWRTHDCSHGEGAAVVCSEIRLVNGSDICSGRIQLFYNQDWMTICGDGFNLNTAKVICRQLGCGVVLKFRKKANGYTSGLALENDFTCEGTEASLSYCQGRYVYGKNCKYNSATVTCADIRLVNGTSHCSGRVEMLHNQQWQTVCDDGWDLNSANIVCRELDCGEALPVPRGAPFGRGYGATCLTGARCQGTEDRFKDCDLNWETHNCSHGEDASVVCSGNASVEHSIRLGVSGLVLLVLVLILAEAVYSWRRRQL